MINRGSFHRRNDLRAAHREHSYYCQDFDFSMCEILNDHLSIVKLEHNFVYYRYSQEKNVSIEVLLRRFYRKKINFKIPLIK